MIFQQLKMPERKAGFLRVGLKLPKEGKAQESQAQIPSKSCTCLLNRRVKDDLPFLSFPRIGILLTAAINNIIAITSE